MRDERRRGRDSTGHAPVDDTIDAAPVDLNHALGASWGVNFDPLAHACDQPTRSRDPFDPDEALAMLEPGSSAPFEQIGRFQVQGVLGSGGMGTVLRAYDDTLGRTVALKLLHHRHDARREQRLLREAQALARLSHPNVVQVYEMGMVEDQLFIAMELVPGQTLRRWQHQDRSWRERLNAYIQAGRGLAAAHAVGLIHRDFKADNCIVGEDGRVRVLDFGLARGYRPADDDETARSNLSEVTHSGGHDLGLRPLTRSGTVLGTMVYLPLQQLKGLPASAQTDQYSFCVSLYEGLYGVHPFVEHSMGDLMASLEQSDLRPVPRGCPIPRRVRQILLRGLSQDPNERWPSMEILLSELERVLKPRRWWVTATVGSLVAALGVTGALLQHSTETLCDAPEAGLLGAWGSTDREAVRAAILSSGHPDASHLVDSVEHHLDLYTRAWVQMAEQSCRATFVEHQQSQNLFDRRMRCLQRRRNRLRSTLDSLREAQNSQQVAERMILPFMLPRLEPCADVDALMAAQPPPSDPILRSRLAQLREQIDHANTLRESGQLARGLDVATALVEQARSLDYPPALAEALECLGHLQANDGSTADALDTLDEAIEVAAHARADDVAARAWALMIFALQDQDELDQGLTLERAVRAAVLRSGDETARGWMLNNLGALHGQRGDLSRARDYLRRALDFKRRTLGDEHVEVGIAWFNLGHAQVTHGSGDEAMEAFQQAREIFELTVGPSHPFVGFVATGSGKLHAAQGRTSEAIEHHLHALSIRLAAFGPEHPQVARSLRYLGESERDGNRPEDARMHLQRALDMGQRLFDPNDFEIARTLTALALLELSVDRPQAARPYAERAVAITGAGQASPEDRAQSLFALARSVGAQDRRRARSLAQSARELYASMDHPNWSALSEVEIWLTKHPLDPPRPEGEPPP
ncbi:MAG: serine/threonine-protein kinase [Myxococcota bacterium]